MRCRRASRSVLAAVCGMVSLVGLPADRARAAPEPPSFTTARVGPTTMVLGQTLRAEASAVGAAGEPAALAWDFGDGSPSAPGASVGHRYSAPGRFTLTVTATVDGAPAALQSFPVVVLPKPAPAPAAVPSARKPLPFEYVTLFGSFETGVPTVVEFRYGRTGVLVPPTLVTQSMVRVAAPLRPKGAKLVGGAAKVHVIQGTGSAAVFQSAGKLKVGRLPRVTLPPGEVTRSFVRLARGVLTDARDRIAGSPLDTLESAETIASTLAFFDGMAASLDAATGAGAARGKAASDASEFTVELSAATVKQLDAVFAGVIAAGARNTADPGLKLAYETWEDAIRLPPGTEYDPARVAELLAAELAYRERVQQSTAALTEGLSAALAPATTGIATLGVAGLATGNPVAVKAAADLAVCSEILSYGLVLGLSLDAAHAALTGDTFEYEVYLGTAGNLTRELLVSKALGAVVRLGAGDGTDDLFGYLRDLAGALETEIRSLQEQAQPPAPSDASLTVADAQGAEGDSGSRELLFTVSLSAPSPREVVVTCSTSGGTASSGADYSPLQATKLTFAPGTTQRTLAVHVLGDRAIESDETFLVKLSKSTGAPIARAQAVGTILDDDVRLLSAASGSNDALGTVTGCGDSTTLSLDGSVRFEVALGAPGEEATGNVSATTFSPDFGSAFYEWEGPLTWNGDTLSGTLIRKDNPARPAATLTITRGPDHQYLLTATVPLTFFLFQTDGSCTGPLHTFNHQADGVMMQVQ